jgi:hypothetical protein
MLERVSREIFDISAIEKRSKKMEQTSKIAIKIRYKNKFSFSALYIKERI